MKKYTNFLLATVLLLVAASAHAQLPDGSIAPNFTVTDIDGNTHTLYDYLDAGIPVVLEFTATWCPPCWSYHQSYSLQQLYDNHGPDATNEVMVIFIESDDATTLADLNGTSGNTQGDWLTGSNFPIVDDQEALFEAYSNTYFPTIYTICANAQLIQSGQLSYAQHLAIIQQSSCSDSITANDPAILNYTGPTSGCSNSIDAQVTLFNGGFDDLTALEITTTGCANCPLVTNWTGLLGSLETEAVQIPNVQLTSDSQVQFQITSVNDDVNDDTVTQDMFFATDVLSEIHIDVWTDCWPEESAWFIFDENFAVVASGTYIDAETNYSDVVNLPDGCYSFQFTDVFGDGLNGTQGGCANDGSVLVTSVNPDQSTFSVIWDYDGSGQFFETTRSFTICAGGCPGCTDTAACNFDSLAIGDDGSCVYGDVCGCTDPVALNFDSLAIWNDGSCEYVILNYGTVTDVAGNIYDLDAIAAGGQKILFHFLADWNTFDVLITPDINDIYTLYGCNTADVFVIGVNSEGNDAVTQAWTDTNGYLAPVVSIDGGADPLMVFFGVNAWPTVILCDQFVTLDGNVYAGWDGETTDNFNLIAPTYSISQNSCVEDYYGCMDTGACNYSSLPPLATIDDGSCDYSCNQNCTNIGLEFWNGIAPGVYPMETTVMEFGVPHASELIFNTTFQYFDEDSQNTFVIDSVAVNSVISLPNGMGVELPTSAVMGGAQDCMPLTGIPTEEGLFTAAFNCTVYLNIFGNVLEINDVIYTHVIEVTPNVNGIYGCTYSFSPNYNPLATIDDGTCTSPDCSTNCGPGTMWDEQFEMCVPNASTCVQDLDNNGEVDTLDLLSLLGAFGSTCE
jgi:thiol-disulfide isomerase/thioredoxin